jgi:hypothetical protein
MPQYPAAIDLTQPNGTDVFQFEDAAADRLGFSVAAGDVNGDGRSVPGPVAPC